MAPGISLDSDEGSGLGCDVIETSHVREQAGQGWQFRGVELQAAVAQVSAGHPGGPSRVFPNVTDWASTPSPLHTSDFSLG